MNRRTAFLAAIACCAAGSVYAFSEGGPGGTWPQSWPKELEPLRKQAWTWVGGLAMNTSYAIPFATREEFESAWRHILKVKSKGASITLKRGPHVHVETAKTAGVLILPLSDTSIVLVVDGEIVDLNRIAFPAETPIIDERFKDEKKK
jgi:hypothetical protein